MNPLKFTCSTLLLVLILCRGVYAHESALPLVAQVDRWLSSLGGLKKELLFDFEDAERYRFKWTPGRRAGLALDALSLEQKQALRQILNSVLSEQGARKVDAILATEAALAVIQNAPEYRNPNKYYTAIFAYPSSSWWALRFEGHHLSVNLTFKGNRLVSASPLFLGAHPETIPRGPDKGLRALKEEVDLAKKLFKSFDREQKKRALASGEWFAGFLTDPGSRRASMGEAVGIESRYLNKTQQRILRELITVYVENMTASFALDYLEKNLVDDWGSIRFFWQGSPSKGEDFYYRVVGPHLLIEMDTQSGDNHIHAIWRDKVLDFGGR